MPRNRHPREWTTSEGFFIDEDEFEYHTIPGMVMQTSNFFRTLTKTYTFDVGPERMAPFKATQDKLWARTRAIWRWFRIVVYEMAKDIHKELGKNSHEEKHKELLTSMVHAFKQLLQNVQKEGRDGHILYQQCVEHRNPERFFEEIVKLRPWNPDEYLPPLEGFDEPFPKMLMEVVDHFVPMVKILLPHRRDMNLQMQERWDYMAWISEEEKFDHIYGKYLKSLHDRGDKDYFPVFRSHVFKYLDDEDSKAYLEGRQRHFGPTGL